MRTSTTRLKVFLKPLQNPYSWPKAKSQIASQARKEVYNMVAILNYCGGNTHSVKHALNRLGASYMLTDNAQVILSADKLIIPGVGSAGAAMTDLKQKGLIHTIKTLETPVLGICLGLQVLCSWSEEDETSCLGIFNSKVKRFPNKGIVPHMGWNEFTEVSGELFKGIKETEHCYFVHSYYAEKGDETTATTNYIMSFSAAMEKNNFYATQFHPEKSSSTGQKILKNFLSL